MSEAIIKEARIMFPCPHHAAENCNCETKFNWLKEVIKRVREETAVEVQKQAMENYEKIRKEERQRILGIIDEAKKTATYPEELNDIKNKIT